MTNFNGITPKAIELLSENRFNDSKAFYEEHKEELKQLATIPMRQIVLDLAEMMMGQKPKIYHVVEEGRLLGVINRHNVMQAIHAQLGTCFVHQARV